MTISCPSKESSLPKPQEEDEKKPSDVVQPCSRPVSMLASAPQEECSSPKPETQDGKTPVGTSRSSSPPVTTPSSTKERPSLLDLPKPDSKDSPESINPDHLCCCRLRICRNTHCGSSHSPSTPALHHKHSDRNDLCPYYNPPKATPATTKDQRNVEKEIKRRLEILDARNQRLDVIDRLRIKKIQDAKNCKTLSQETVEYIISLEDVEGQDVKLRNKSKAYAKLLRRRIASIKLPWPTYKLEKGKGKEKEFFCEDCKEKTIKEKFVTRWLGRNDKGKKVERRREVSMKKMAWSCCFEEESKWNCELPDHEEQGCFCVDNPCVWEKGNKAEILNLKGLGYYFDVGKHTLSCWYYRRCSEAKIEAKIDARRQRWFNIVVEPPTAQTLRLIEAEMSEII